MLNGKIFVHNYEKIEEVPKDEVIKQQNELLDYIEYDLLGKQRPEREW